MFLINRGAASVEQLKFDHKVLLTGERMQLHRTGDGGCDMHYYSRNAVEHGEYSSYTAFNKAACAQLTDLNCILDGEMVIWNKLA